jgi:hypothetical protein
MPMSSNEALSTPLNPVGPYSDANHSFPVYFAVLLYPHSPRKSASQLPCNAAVTSFLQLRRNSFLNNKEFLMNLLFSIEFFGLYYKRVSSIEIENYISVFIFKLLPFDHILLGKINYRDMPQKNFSSLRNRDFIRFPLIETDSVLHFLLGECT